MKLVAATPGLYVLTRVPAKDKPGKYNRRPVIAWRIPEVGDVRRAEPVTVNDVNIGQSYVLYDGTFVIDLSGVDAAFYDSPTVWMAATLAKSATIARRPADGEEIDDSEVPAFLKKGARPDASAATADEEDSLAIKFGEKTFSQKSYWAFKTLPRVFEIGAGEPLPTDSRVVKIKRDEFAEKRRNGAVLVIPDVLTEEEPHAEEKDYDDVL